MTPTLSPQQREALREVVFDVLWPLQTWEMDPQVCRAAVDATLDAALPAIIGAVLTSALKEIDDYIAYLNESSETEEDPDYRERFLVYAKHVRRATGAIRALAEEAR